MLAGYLLMNSFFTLSLFAMSSSSPPQPQNMFENPFTICGQVVAVVIANTIGIGLWQWWVG